MTVMIAIVGMSCLYLLRACASSQSVVSMDKYRKLKLTYFDARGPAEVSRIMLKIGGVEFEDHRLPITKKPDGGFDVPEFASVKESGLYAANMNRLPVLNVDGIIIGQSRAIERYIAQHCKLMGKDEIERALVDCITENVRDIKDRWGKVRLTGGLGKSAIKDEAVAKWFSGGELAEWLTKLDHSLPQPGTSNQQEYAVGDSLSLADISIWHLLRDYFTQYDNEVRAAEKKAKCAKLSRIANKVAEHSVVKNWMLCRPPTQF